VVIKYLNWKYDKTALIKVFCVSGRVVSDLWYSWNDKNILKLIRSEDNFILIFIAFINSELSEFFVLFKCISSFYVVDVIVLLPKLLHPVATSISSRSSISGLSIKRLTSTLNDIIYCFKYLCYCLRFCEYFSLKLLEFVVVENC
jgi:hypothetical protein